MDLYDKYDFTEDRLTPRHEERERKGTNELIQYYDGISETDHRDRGR